jgi:hypothetical protein
MKSLLLTILFFCSSVITLAQNHITEKVNLTNSIWVQTYYNQFRTYSNVITTTDDTLMSDGLTYLKMYVTHDTIVLNASVVGGLRFDSVSNKIYINDTYTNGIGMILYDFSLAVGDTLSKTKGYYLLGVYDSSPNTPLRVMNIDTVLTNDGVSRKRFHILTHQIIDGIGNVTYHFNKMLDYMVPGETPEPVFMCYKRESKCVFANDCSGCFPYSVGITEKLTKKSIPNIYPNPVDGSLNLNLPATINVTHAAIYNLNGQLIMWQNINKLNLSIDVSTLTKGIYYCELQSTDGAVIRHKFVKK